MAGLTPQEKDAFEQVLDAVKAWWHAEPNSVADVNAKRKLIKAVERIKEESER